MATVRLEHRSHNHAAGGPDVDLQDHEFDPGGGSHPDLTAHDILGLATQAELDAHEIAVDPHTVYALDADLTSHVGAADPHTGYQRESEKGLANGYASLDASGLVPDAQIPAAIARDSELHARQHSVTAVSDHTFPGGTTNFLREDGTFAAPPGGGGQAFPVGAVFIAVVATNPATLLGYGTWAAFGAGRVLVGLDAADADFDLVEETGGAKTKAVSAHTGTAVANHVVTQPSAHSDHADVTNHTHTVSHSHTQRGGTATTGGLSGATWDTSTSGGPSNWGYSTTTDAPTSSNPSGGVAAMAHSAHSGTAVDAHGVTQPSAHADLNVVQPYIVCYFWKRTA